MPEVRRMNHRAYGCRPDTPDQRDHLLMIGMPESTLPSSIDLRSHCPPVLDQGQLGSCTAHALANLHRFDQMAAARGKPSFLPSRLFIYWNERSIENTIASDAGAEIRDGIKVLAKLGA